MEYKLDKLSALDKVVLIVLHSDGYLRAETIDKLVEMQYLDEIG